MIDYMQRALNSASIVSGLGYTPVNKAGDTMTGDLLFTDNLYDIGKSGATRPRDGFFSRNLYAGGFIEASAVQTIGFTSRSFLASSADGLIRLMNQAGTDFGRLQFGGLTSSFPSLKRSTTELHVRLADDSNFAGMQADYFQAANGFFSTSGAFYYSSSGSGVKDLMGTGSPEGVVSAPVGSTYRRSNGGAGTSFYVKESGTGNTGWVAK